MVRAWFMDDDVEADQRLEHHRNPPQFVDLEKLLELTGVEYFKVNSTGNRTLALERSSPDKFQMPFDKKSKMHSNAILKHIPEYLVKIPCAEIGMIESIFKELHSCEQLLIHAGCELPMTLISKFLFRDNQNHSTGFIRMNIRF